MTSPTASEQHAPMSYTMFVVVVAALMGMNPLAIDIMLPAFGLITSHYDLSNPNAVHTVITFYLLGFGLGQLLVGTFADSFGRKPILLVGVALYTLAGLGCALAPNFEALLAARFVCGLASAAPRVVATAMVRDCYDGRTMARVMALAMTFFMAMPLFAPLLGQIIVMVAPWQWIFGFVVVYGAVLFWVCFSALPETIRPEFRRPIAFTAMAEATRSVLGSRQTAGYAVAAGIFFGALFGFINSAQQIMTEIFGLGALFPVVFAIIAFAISIASFVNSQMVERFGMRRISHIGIVGFTVGSAVLLVLETAGLVSLWVFLPLFGMLMIVIGLVFANFNALAMEPQGHVAGMASSLTGAISVLLGALIGYIIGQGYDGTMVPLFSGFLLCGLVVLAILLWVEKGRLFGAQAPA